MLNSWKRLAPLLASGLVCLLTTSNVALSQPTAPTPGSTGSNVNSPTKLYLVTRVDPEIDEDLVDLFRKAIGKTDNKTSCDVEKIKATAIDSERYQFLSGIIKNATDPRYTTDGVSIGLDEKDGQSWHFYVGNKYFDLLRLKIFYGDEAKPQEIEYKGEEIGSPDEKDAPVVARRPGWYFIKLPAGIRPNSYEAEVLDVRKTDGMPEMRAGSWPLNEKYYLVELPGFTGSRDALREVLGNSKLTANPVAMETVTESVTFWEAGLGDIPPGGTTEINENIVKMKLHKPNNRSPKRVWVKFPLTEQQAQDTIAAFKSEGKWINAKQISKAIRDAEPISIPDVGDAIPQYRLHVAEVVQSAKWYEMSRSGATEAQWVYHGEWVCPNVGEWKALKEPHDWRVYVFEFEDGTDVQAVFSQHPTRSGKVLAVDSNMGGWNLKLTEPKAPANAGSGSAPSSQNGSK